MAELSHVDKDGRARMVDITGKPVTHREAVARCVVLLGEPLYSLVLENGLRKGDVISTSKIAGIMGAKKTSELIPLCHPLKINNIDLKFELLPEKKAIEITSIVKTDDKTGVEMEALTAVSIAALTVYDMGKAVTKDIQISDIRLLKKSGGKSGTYLRSDINENR